MPNKPFDYSALHSRGERLRNYDTPKKPNYSLPSWRDDPSRSIPSKPPSAHSTTRKETLTYTGSYVKGIATMHKSNTVPVTDKSQAIDISNMRRNK